MADYQRVQLPLDSIIPSVKDVRWLLRKAGEAGLAELDTTAVAETCLKGFRAVQRELALEPSGPVLSDVPAVATYMAAIAGIVEGEDSGDVTDLENEAKTAVEHHELWLDVTSADDANPWAARSTTQELRAAWVRANDPSLGTRGRREAMADFLARFREKVTAAANPSQQRKQFTGRMLPMAAKVRLDHARTNVALVQDPAEECKLTTKSEATPSDRIEHVDPRSLVIPPVHEEVFGPRSKAELEDLTASIAAFGVRRPPTVTGEGCASPPGTVLEGACRTQSSVEADVNSIPVRVLDGLTKEQEDDILLRSNLLDDQARTLNERQRYEVERRLMALHGKTQGQRTDVSTSPNAQGSGRHERETPALIAREVGATRTAVADRMKVFGSPVSTEALKEALTTGAVKRAAAAKLVRDVEKRHGALDSVNDTVLRSARAEVDAWVEHRTKHKKPEKPKSKRLQQLECFAIAPNRPAELWEGTVPTRKIQVVLEDGKVLVRWYGQEVVGGSESA